MTTIYGRHIRRVAAGSALAVAMAVGAAGCGSAAESLTKRVAEKACSEIGKQSNGGDVTDCKIDTENGGVQINTASGSFGVGSGAKVPDGFPSFLVPEGDLKPTAAVSSGGSMSVTYKVDDATAASAKLVEAATSNGCTTSNDNSTGVGAVVMLKCADGDATILAQAAAENGLVINFSKKSG